MQKTGITIHLSELKNQLHKVQDLQSTSNVPVKFDVRGDIVDPNDPNPELAPLQNQPNLPPKPKVKD